MQTLRKILAISMIFVTVLSLTATVAPKASAAASAGDLIKMNGLSSVYYLGADGKRYVFPNEATYFSWYSDFSSVVTVPQAELEALPLGANVTIRPGTKLVKITTNPKVYAVTAGGTLVAVPDEATAKALYGDNWAKRVVDVADAFFTNYKIGAGVLSATAYPAGSLIKTATSPDIYYIDATGAARKIASETAFNANRFQFANVITTTLALPTAGADITAADSTISDTSSGAGGVINVGGSGLTVSLASDTATAKNIPTNSTNEFVKFNLTASNDGAVKVTNLTLTAYGLGSATDIKNISVFDGGVKQGSTKSQFSSDKNASFTFTNPVTIAAGTTKTLSVKAETTGTGSYAIGIAAGTAVTTGGATVSGSFPVIGNSMTGITSANIGTVTVSSVNATAQSQKFGTDNVLLAGFNMTAANEPVLLSSLRFKNGGTNKAGIASNLKIVIDGKEVKTGVELTDRYATFDTSNYELPKGTAVAVEVYGDLGIANANDTVNLYLENATDVVLTGKDYGYGITATGTTAIDAAGEGVVVTLTTGSITLDMDKSSTTGTAAKEVKAGDTDVALATIKIVSNSENATLDQIVETGAGDFYISGTGLTTGEISNVELVDTTTGSVYSVTETASTTVGTTGGFTLSLTDPISLPKGVTKIFRLRADLSGSTSNTPIDNNDTLKVTLAKTAMKVTGDTSNASITDITPSSVAGAIVTVKAASLTWSTVSLTSKNFVPGASDVVYKAELKAGASSDVSLTSVKISTTANNKLDFSDSNIAQLDLVVNGTTVKTVSGQIVEATAGTAGSITFNTLSNVKVAAGATAVLEVKAKFASNFTTSGTQFGLGIAHATDSIVAKDAANNAVVESLSQAVNTASRLITLASTGTLKAELKTTDTKADADTYLLAGAETTKDRYLAELVLTTANEPVKVKTLVLGQAGTAVAGDIKAVKLYDKTGAVVASVAPSAEGYANFDALNVTLPADQATSYFVGVVAKSINADGDAEGTGTFGRTVIFNFASSTQLTALGLAANTAVTAEGANSGQAITIVEDTNASVAAGDYAGPTVQSKTTTLTGSVLTSIVSAKANTTLTAGVGQEIAKYTFVFNNGTKTDGTGYNRNADNTELKAELNQLILTVASSSGVSLANVKAYIEGAPSSVTSATSSPAGVATIDLTTMPGTTELVNGTVTLIITADVTVTGTGSKYLQTKINSLSTDFTYNGNSGTGSDFANARLDITEVVGANLSATF